MTLITIDQFCTIHDACSSGREWALTRTSWKHLWDTCERVDWMLWILEVLPIPPEALRGFAAHVAENTPIGDGRICWDLLTDERSKHAIRVASWHACGMATDEELKAARAAAGAAAWDAAGAAARDAARDAAWDAAWDAAGAAARDAAWDAAGAAAGDAARKWQANELRIFVPDITPYLESQNCLSEAP